jgi:hypothetical protein
LENSFSLFKNLLQQMPSTRARTSTIREPSVSPGKSRKSGAVWDSNLNIETSGTKGGGDFFSSF